MNLVCSGTSLNRPRRPLSSAPIWTLFHRPQFFVLCRIQIADVDYKKAFEDELRAFKDRIRRRAEEKIREQVEEAKLEEEEERKARLGPGGLDPVEVFENLPDVSNVDPNYRKTE